MGHKFTLILNREITEDEVGALKEAGCPDSTVSSTSRPGDTDTLVTQLDFDTEVPDSLAEAIEAALAAVKEIPDLSVPTLTVPAQPSEPEASEDGADAPAGELEAGEAAEATEAGETAETATEEKAPAEAS